jgi:hypothetical protein
MQVIKKEDCARVGRSNETVPSLPEGVSQQGASRTQEIAL